MNEKEQYYYQVKNLEYLKNTYGRELWTQVSGHRTLNGTAAAFWSMLIPLSNAKKIYRNVSWDLDMGTQAPFFDENAKGYTYKSVARGFYGCENIVHYREFHGVKKNYVELTEEFRFLNNLFHDVETNKFYEIADNGECIEVAKIEDDLSAFIKLSYLMRYASAKQMALVLFFDIRTEIKGTLNENGLKRFCTKPTLEDDLFYGYTIGYEVCNDGEHYVRYWCDNCGQDQHGGVHIEDHSMSGGTCTLCGYSDGSGGGSGGGGDYCYHNSTYKNWSGCTWYEYCNYCNIYLGSGTSHGSTSTSWSGCTWTETCNDCGQVMNSGTSHGSYSYGSWEYYSASQHRRLYACDSCGEGSYSYGSHSTTNYYYHYSDTQHTVEKYCSDCYTTVSSTQASHSYTYDSWNYYDGTQHWRTKTCTLCGYSENEYANHSVSYGSWTSDGDSQHYRTKRCSTCGMDEYDYADHSLSYGSWSNYDSTQHRRTAKCSTCGYSGYDYASHTDSNNDGKCDTCSATMPVTITWNTGSGSVTTSQTVNAALVLPSPEPSKTGYTFDGWFTAQSGGTQVTPKTTYTTSLGTTFYAHWTQSKVFSVTVPMTIALVMDADGQVRAASTKISNGSSGAVEISSITLTALNGWTLVPYSTNMAKAKVDSKQIGLSLNGVETTVEGSEETLSLPSAWSIPSENSLPLTFEAVASAMSAPVQDETVLSVTFVVRWA